jgi:hypothetical protein
MCTRLSLLCRPALRLLSARAEEVKCKRRCRRLLPEGCQCGKWEEERKTGRTTPAVRFSLARNAVRAIRCAASFFSVCLYRPQQVLEC